MVNIYYLFIYFFQHEEEPPQNMRPGAAGEKSLSKSALKNQKKREAKKAAKQVNQSDGSKCLSACPDWMNSSCQEHVRLNYEKKTFTYNTCINMITFILKDAKSEPETPSDTAPISNSQSEPSSGDPETDKKIKNLKKVKNNLFM